MKQDEGKQHDKSGQDPKEAQQDAPNQAQDDVPSTEKEIEPGVNQDKHVGENFSSEPTTEAAGGEGEA